MNTKNRILNTLLIKQEASVNELAEEIGVNGISIRHHLKNFEKNGWVISREERQGHFHLGQRSPSREHGGGQDGTQAEENALTSILRRKSHERKSRRENE